MCSIDRQHGCTRSSRAPQQYRAGWRKPWKAEGITTSLGCVLLMVLLVGCSRKPPVEPSRIPVTSLPSEPAPTVKIRATQAPRASDLPDAGVESAPPPPPQIYVVRKGDTLGSIARRFGCDQKALIRSNQIDDANLLRVGQKLELSACQVETGPATRLLPNSEFVNGPAYADFDVVAFAAAQGGYLGKYQEKVHGQLLSGPEIIELVAHHYSVGPRTLLALMELKSGWVTDPKPGADARSYPMGYKGGGWELLSYQLAWAADQLNRGYYDWRGRGISPLVWRDGTTTWYDPNLNAATAGLHYFLSLNTGKRQWEEWVGTGEGSFLATYRGLFGDPEQYAVEPLIPSNMEMPNFSLPWSTGELWYYTGGPHGVWEEGSAWAALDFVPGEAGYGCRVSSSWATAAAPGLVTYSQDGEVVIDLDRDGHEETGWVLFYLHVATKDRVPVDTLVKRGDPIGHPSCEGGISEATHLHIARKYNGEWIAADGPLPFVLSGWRAHAGGQEYDGTLTRGKEERTACECRIDDYNGLVNDR